MEQLNDQSDAMKLTIERAALLSSLGHVQSVVERRNTIPILSNVKLDAGDGRLGLNATDMDLDVVESVEATLDAESIRAMQGRVAEVNASAPVLDYLGRLVEETRSSPYLSLGLSTRGAISLHRACQARAYLAGRAHLLPDDLKALFMPVCGHRVMVKNHHEGPAERRREADNVLREILETTQVPL